MPSNISSSVGPFFSRLQSFPEPGSFQMSGLRIRWPKYWSFNFSISPSNEYSELISFRIDWFDLLAVQGTLKSFPAPWLESISSLVLSLLYGPTLMCINHTGKTIISSNFFLLVILLEPALWLPMWKCFLPGILLSYHLGISCPYPENPFCSLDSSFYSFLVSSSVVAHRVCRRYIFWGSTNVSKLIFIVQII